MNPTTYAFELQMRFLIEERTKTYVNTAERVPQIKIAYEAKNTSGVSGSAGNQAGEVRGS